LGDEAEASKMPCLNKVQIGHNRQWMRQVLPV
jgi:hypothetical protein